MSLSTSSRKRGDVLLGLLEGEGQLLVLRHGMGELALGLEQALLERAHPAGRLLQAPAELADLVFCLLGAPLQLFVSARRPEKSPCARPCSHGVPTSSHCRDLQPSRDPTPVPECSGHRSRPPLAFGGAALPAAKLVKTRTSSIRPIAWPTLKEEWRNEGMD